METVILDDGNHCYESVLINQTDFLRAYTITLYKNAKDKLEKIESYVQAMNDLENGDYDETIDVLKDETDYADAQLIINNIDYLESLSGNFNI